MGQEAGLPLTLAPKARYGGLKQEEGAAPVPGALWYTTEKEDAGLSYGFPAGALAKARYLMADLLVDGNTMVVFVLTLKEGEAGRTFGLMFSALTQCQARLRMELEAVNQNRWRYEREGAWLKPMCGGDRVDLGKVDRMTIYVLRKVEGRARFCLTPVTATTEEPPRLLDPILPKGPLLDELGQSRQHEWETKSRSAEEVTARLKAQLEAAPGLRFPEGFSRWGGWKERRLKGTGFFRVEQEGGRWWLVDPDGHPFWSSGMDCVEPGVGAAYAGLENALAWRPEVDGPYREAWWHPESEARSIDYLKANFIRAFGPEQWRQRWAEITVGELRRLGFNTVANWSDWKAAQEAGFPYVRPLHLHCRKTPLVYRDFPDVFDPAFAEEAAAYAEELKATADDPAFIGYFLMNEPTWGFAGETPAAGMLFNTPSCATRQALAEFLRERYQTDAALAAAWGMRVTLARAAEGEWRTPLTEAAQADLAAFSTVMAEKLFGGLTEACRRVDPHHLNLGARYYTVPPAWALGGMRCFDVFSVNCYDERVRPELGELSAAIGRPIMVGEWHFGALDVGLPASGLGHVRDQQARGKAYRVYVEDAAAKPWCVGVHYFTLYDESAMGRHDGENYNIGFLDVCNRPYEPLAGAARASHERLYRVAAGELRPYDEAPEYLPKLFL